jgi:hypothetical protein
LDHLPQGGRIHRLRLDLGRSASCASVRTRIGDVVDRLDDAVGSMPCSLL